MWVMDNKEVGGLRHIWRAGEVVGDIRDGAEIIVVPFLGVLEFCLVGGGGGCRRGGSCVWWRFFGLGCLSTLPLPLSSAYPRLGKIVIA